VRELKIFGRGYGFRVIAVKPVKKAGTQVSSSLIRKLLKNGRVELAARFLGDPMKFAEPLPEAAALVGGLVSPPST